MNAVKIAPGRLQVLMFVLAYQRKRGMPPTGRDIAAGLGIYQSAVNAHLLALERKGMIQWDRGVERRRARGIRVLVRFIPAAALAQSTRSGPTGPAPLPA